MQRRTVLAVVGSLLASGCLGAKRPSDAGTSTPRSTRAATDTPTATPEPTPTPEPTETPEPTPSPDDAQAGDDALDAVDEAVAAAVEAFVSQTDDADSLADVTAASEFDARAVFLELDAVQERLAAAESAVVTDDQRTRLDGLRAVESVLTNATAAQAGHAATHAALVGIYDALPYDYDAGENAVNEFESALDSLGPYREAMVDAADSDAFAATDELDADDYADKQDQFGAEASVFGSVEGLLDDLLDAWDDFSEAKAEADDGDDDEAADLAESAREGFDDVAGELDDFVDDISDEASALEPVCEDVLERVENKRETADDRYDDYS